MAKLQKVKIGDYRAALQYLEAYWRKLTFYQPRDRGLRIGLPNRFVAPSQDYFSGDQFYWDTYFIILGLLSNRKVKLAQGMVDNLVYFYRRFGMIPARNRFTNLVGSQPPFLTSMALEIFGATGDKKWLKGVAAVAEAEYRSYWLGRPARREHLVYRGLSRYCSHVATSLGVQYESGWDFTSRFGDDALYVLPVDLNACLYKYEKDFVAINSVLGRPREKARWARAASGRKQRMQLMWDERKGFFFDYNYARRRRNSFWSLAGYYPLWAKLATPEQAKLCVKNLPRFLCPGGLAATQKTGLSYPPRQWDYPNGWAPLQWIVISGLLNYGYRKEALNIAKCWMELNTKVFERTGKFWERYDVVRRREGVSERYPIQTGFGWTNAAYVRLLAEFPELLQNP